LGPASPRSLSSAMFTRTARRPWPPPSPVHAAMVPSAPDGRGPLPVVPCCQPPRQGPHFAPSFSFHTDAPAGPPFPLCLVPPSHHGLQKGHQCHPSLSFLSHGTPSPSPKHPCPPKPPLTLLLPVPFKKATSATPHSLFVHVVLQSHELPPRDFEPLWLQFPCSSPSPFFHYADGARADHRRSREPPPSLEHRRSSATKTASPVTNSLGEPHWSPPWPASSPLRTNAPCENLAPSWPPMHGDHGWARARCRSHRPADRTARLRPARPVGRCMWQDDAPPFRRLLCPKGRGHGPDATHALFNPFPISFSIKIIPEIGSKL
jgi:hypothetical protein